MRVLIIIGAGASFDSWPKHIPTPGHIQKLPLANELFSSKPIQDGFLNRYNLMGLASILRSKADECKKHSKKFDVESELDEISNTANERKDPNRLQDLFKARFYLNSLISELTKTSLSQTQSHTVYTDFLNQLKEWIDEDQNTRFIDIVSFNYDTLLEDAMHNVYGYNWSIKRKGDPIRAYLLGKNLKIFKPHGSINWGREIAGKQYRVPEELFIQFNEIELNKSFKIIDPNRFLNREIFKDYIPAIAVPFKNKTHFEECTQEMLVEMLKAITKANKIITLGWRGADKHFTDLLKTNGKAVKEVHIVSPTTDTYLDKIFSKKKIKPIKATFRHFINETRALESLLRTFSS